MLTKWQILQQEAGYSSDKIAELMKDGYEFRTVKDGLVGFTIKNSIEENGEVSFLCRDADADSKEDPLF